MEDWKVGLEFRKACERFVEDRTVCFVFSKAYKKLVEVQIVTFHKRKE